MMKASKRFVSVLLLVSLVASMLILPTAGREYTMLKNGDFEKRLSGWEHWTSDTSVGSITSVADGGVDGSGCAKIENTAAVPSSLYQYITCTQGSRYMVTCDVRYENVSTDGQGVCLGVTAYDAAGNNIGEILGSSSFGTSSEWRTVSYIFEITNNPARVNIGCRLWASSGTLYIDNMSVVELSDEPAESGTYDLLLSDTPNRHTVDSLGCEWDPKMLLPVNQAHGITEDDLAVMKTAIDTLGLQAVRMMISPEWFEPVNDNGDPAVADAAGFDLDNPEMQSVFAYLKVCEELGIRVTLTWWGAPTGCWLASENTGDWIGAPNDLDEMTENIIYLLGYIRNDLGYTCVKELILHNEPSYSFRVDGGAVDFNYYAEYYRTVHARLAAEGMSDIVLVGSDDSQDAGWYLQCADALSDICGKFDSHNYNWSYDTPYLDVLIQEFVSARTSATPDTPFYLGEFGDGSTEGAYIATSTDTHGRGIYIASLLVNAFKAGASGASYWPLHDIYYYENTAGGDNGGLMSMGLIGFKEDGAWTYRPSYYAYGLLCNAIPYGSEVYNITGDTNHSVDTVAFKTPEGRWSIVAVNRSDAAQTLNISAAAIGTVMQMSALTAGDCPTEGNMVTPHTTVTPEGGVYSFTVANESIVVLSNIGMTEEEMALPGASESDTAEETAAGETDTAADTDAVTAVTEVTEMTEEVTDTATDTVTDTDTADGETTAPVEGGCASAAAGAALMLAVPAAALTVKRRRKDE